MTRAIADANEREPFDAEYVRLLTDGDPETERHFTAYFGELLRIKLRGKVRSVEAAEDVRQETFARVFETLRRKGGVERPERLGAFVHSVCNHVLFEYYRSDKRMAGPPEDAFDPPSGEDLEAALVNDERKRRVLDVLQRLPGKDRQVLRMVFLEDLDKDDVCRRMNVDRNYLRVLLHRATNKLRDNLRASNLPLFFSLNLA